MDLHQKALAILNKAIDQRENDIIQEWKSASGVEHRERCATDLRALEGLKELIEDVAHNE